MSELSLKTDFPAALRSDWQALVEGALRGGKFSSLVHTTEDGFARGPLSAAEDRPENIAPVPRADTPLRAGRPWHVCAPVRDADLAFANTQLLADLEGGASAVRLEFAKGGLQAKNANEVKRVLDQVLTNLVPITLAPSPANAEMTNILLGMDTLRGVHLDLGLDPLREVDAVQIALKSAPEIWRVVTIDAGAIHDSGGTAAQEIGGMAAALADTLRSYDPKAVAPRLNIELCVDQDGHLNIAKLRAMRRVCARVLEAFSLPTTPVPFHAVSSRRMLQSTDPWTNMLRIMSASFGAICGGADFITARPFTDSLGDATPFGYRIARNMQLMMQEESHLGQVSDPAHGSYFHEKLSDDLAQSGWTVFQDIERAGGVQSDTLSKMIAVANAERSERAEPILGVTLHPAEALREAKVRKAAS